jgi:hypothetical protein
MRALLLLLLATSAAAQDPADFERILLPISFRGEVPGAFGTRWTTLTVLFNDSASPVQFVNSVCEHPEPSQCGTLSPRAYINVQSPSSETLPSQGAYFYIPRAAAGDLHFTSILFDQSRAEENAGTELPVVREDDFRHRIVLPMVLTRGPFRVALRIYGSDDGPAPVRVRFYRLDRLDPFVDEVVTMNGRNTREILPFPPHPAFFHVFDIVTRWPQLEATSSVRVELEALDRNRKIWAFASQTNNATQLVTTVRPQ